MNTSIRARLKVSFIANVIRSGLNFVTGLIVARAMGPEQFGRMAFLLATFMAVKQLLDMGTSTVFFTLLSQRQRSRKFACHYWLWMGLQLLLILAAISFAPEAWLNQVWKGEARVTLIIAALAAFMLNGAWSVASQMGEAQRQTVRVQRINTLVVAVHLAIVVALWRTHQMNIIILLIAVSIEWLIASWLAAGIYFKTTARVAIGAAPHEHFLGTTKELWQYAWPLLPMAWMGFVYDFADRWMLQHWGGAKEQAYYAVAQQFSSVALLATASILRVFWKEIAEAHNNKDAERVRILYKRASRGLYYIGAAVAAGVMPWTVEIIDLTLGEAYKQGSVAFAIMIFYPVHQCLGQVTGVMFMATNHNRWYSLLGIVSMSLSVVVGYFLMAPVDTVLPGLGLASRGLAWKMVLLQLCSVNVAMAVIAKLFKMPYDGWYQLYILALLIPLGWAVKVAIMALEYELSTSVLMASSSIIYGLTVVLLAIGLPGLAGLQKGNRAIFVR